MTIANVITGIRIILAPIFVIYLLQDRLLTALLVFALAGLSDGADGLVARVFNQKSRLGAYLDPLADKLLLVAAFVVLGVRGLAPVWLAVAIISRDVLILLGVMMLFVNRMEITVKPSYLSKINTFFQLVTVAVVLAGGQFPILSRIAPYVFILTGFFTISSGLHYMYCWFQMAGDAPGK